jgi:hypothetical protein
MKTIHTLTRDEMKQIKGGHGGCHIYCCSESTSEPGTHNCSTAVDCPECTSTTNEGCQQEAIANGFICTGSNQFIAALYFSSELGEA